MSNLINHLIEEGLENIMERSTKALLLEDEIYINDRKAKEWLEKRYDALNLDVKDRLVINDYIACIGTVRSRIEELSYIAGISDAVKLLNSLGLLKK